MVLGNRLKKQIKHVMRIAQSEAGFSMLPAIAFTAATLIAMYQLSDIKANNDKISAQYVSFQKANQAANQLNLFEASNRFCNLMEFTKTIPLMDVVNSVKIPVVIKDANTIGQTTIKDLFKAGKKLGPYSVDVFLKFFPPPIAPLDGTPIYIGGNAYSWDNNSGSFFFNNSAVSSGPEAIELTASAVPNSPGLYAVIANGGVYYTQKGMPWEPDYLAPAIISPTALTAFQTTAQLNLKLTSGYSTIRRVWDLDFNTKISGADLVITGCTDKKTSIYNKTCLSLRGKPGSSITNPSCDFTEKRKTTARNACIAMGNYWTPTGKCLRRLWKAN